MFYISVISFNTTEKYPLIIENSSYKKKIRFLFWIARQVGFQLMLAAFTASLWCSFVARVARVSNVAYLWKYFSYVILYNELYLVLAMKVAKEHHQESAMS